MSLRSSGRLAIAGVVIAGLALGGVAPGASASSLPGWLHTAGAEIKTASNATFVIKAVTWSGMERATCTPNGLTKVSLDAALANIAGLGFNTVRLSYSNECLASTLVANVDPLKNPSMYGKTALKVMDAIIARAALYDLNVVLVRDRVSATSEARLWYTTRYSQARWIADWKMLASRYAQVLNVIGFDLASNPGTSSCWGCDSKARDWQAAATKAGNAIHKVNSRLLIIVGGVGSTTKGYRSSDGGGLEGVAKHPVKLTVKHRVVYSAHEYSPTINPQKYYKYGKWSSTVTKAWNAHWGYLATKKIAPVMLGEFGAGITNAKDKKWLKTIVAYATKKKIGFAYFSFIPTGSKSGGVTDADGTTRNVRSLYLEPLLGLAKVVPEVVDEPTPTASPVPEEPDGNSATMHVTSTWNEGWVGEILVSSEKGVSNWTLRFPEPNATAITSQYGMTCSIAASFITCVSDGYFAKIPAGESRTVGLQVASVKPLLDSVGIVVTH